MFTVVSPVGFCEATLLEVKFLPSHSSHWPADSFYVCTAGTAEGFGEQHHENGAAFIHRCLWCCVCGGDWSSLSWQDGRGSSGSTFVLPYWFTADGPADFQHCSQGRNLQTHSYFHYNTAMRRMWLCWSHFVSNALLQHPFLVAFLSINPSFKNNFFWHFCVKISEIKMFVMPQSDLTACSGALLLPKTGSIKVCNSNLHVSGHHNKNVLFLDIYHSRHSLVSIHFCKILQIY